MSDAPDLSLIYATQAERYDALISREDAAGAIPRALWEIRDPTGLDVVDLGAGTGRLTRLIAPVARRIVGLDASRHMLEVASRRLSALPRAAPWALAVADHRALPLAARSADLVVAGWTLCYAALHVGEGWVASLDTALAEARRLLRPGGALVILETLGTGYTEPHPPEALAPYLGRLEALGMRRRWIRTDYAFESLEEAAALTRFFFGDTLARRVRRERLTVLPECTGIWWEEAR